MHLCGEDKETNNQELIGDLTPSFDDIYNEGGFPIIAKPIAGKQGKGVVKIENIEIASSYINQFFKVSTDADNPVFFQKYINFIKEFRVVLVDGKAFGIVEKLQDNDKVVKNVAAGGRFLSTQENNITSFVETHCSAEGILGVDVGVDSEDDIHVIEANRAPLWKAFQNATGVNIAQEIVKCALKKIS